MSKGTLGSFSGVAVPGENMVDVFKRLEIEKHEYSILNFCDFMILHKLAIECEAGTNITINGSKIPIPATGVFEIGFGQLDITSIIFDDAVEINAYYMY